MFLKQTHFIWSRTELLGRCDIAVVYVSAGAGVGTRSSRDPSVRMVGLVGSHTHLTHLALKLRKRRMWMKQTNIKLQQQHLLSLPLHMPKKYNTEMFLIWTMIGLICIKGLLTVAKIYLIMLYFYLTSMFFSPFYNKHAKSWLGSDIILISLLRQHQRNTRKKICCLVNTTKMCCL